MIRPDGLGHYSGETFEQLRVRYPDAERATLDEFCAWKAEQQRTPITWNETTAEQYDYMLGCLPPADMWGDGFLVGEPSDHDAGNGQPRFQGFRQRGGRYEVASRPLTRAEFRAEVAA